MPPILSAASASQLVYLGIPALAAIMIAVLAWGVAHAERELGTPEHASRRAVWSGLGGVAWAAFGLLLAQSGVLGRFASRPPPLLVFLVFGAVTTITLARSRFGERLVRGLPLSALIASQAFRLPLELVLHRAAHEGTMPIEMSFSGYNFDIVSGASAVIVALAFAYTGVRPWLAWLWNAIGVLLLLNVVGIAIAATPTFHAFGPEHLNVWVTQPPFVLLPSVLVMTALFGHVLVFRKLLRLDRESLNASGTGPADRHRLRTARAKP
jgi:hypothetical protein